MLLTPLLAWGLGFALLEGDALSNEAPGVNEDSLAWPGFRGPHGLGVSAMKRAPRALDPKKNVDWKIEMEPGYSSPICAEERIFLTYHRDKKPHVACLDQSSGETLWSCPSPESETEWYAGPNSPVSPTPVTNGELVVAFFPTFGLVAYDFEGEVLWKRPLGPFNVPHGMSTSPLIHGDVIVLLCDQDTDAFLAAYKVENGEEVWKVERKGVAHSYSSPIVFQPKSGPAQVVVNGSYQVSSYNLETGEKIWWVDGMAWSASTTPTFLCSDESDDLLIVHSWAPALSEFGAPKITETWEEAVENKDANGDERIGLDEWEDPMLKRLWFIYDLDNDGVLDAHEWEVATIRGQTKGGVFGIRMDGKGDVTDSHIAWHFDDRRAMPDHASPLLFDDVLYLLTNAGILTTVDPATGDVLKQGRLGDSDEYFASPIAAAGVVIAVGKSGQLVTFTAEGEWELISSSHLNETIWATPALFDGHVIVRTEDSLYSFGVTPGN